MKSNTLIIFGSSRGDGNTRMIADFLQEKLGCDFMDLTQYSFTYYDYDYQNQDDDFISISDKMVKYEKIIFCTPVYWYSMSAVMKTYIDRFSDLVRIRKPVGRALAGKTIFALCCSSDAEEYDGFFMPFEKTAGYLDMHYGGDVHTWVEEEKIPAEVQTRLEKFAQSILKD